MKHIPILLALAFALPLCAAERLRVTDDYYAWRAFMLQQSDSASPLTNCPLPDMNITNLLGDPPGTVTHFGANYVTPGWPVVFELMSNISTEIVTNRTVQKLDGRFWLEWVVETNDYAPRRTMGGFAWTTPTNYWNGGSIYNYYNSFAITNGILWLQPEPEPTEGTETYYVSSNLWFHVVWRGRTNSDCLESIPVRTEVRRWKTEKQKVYIP